VLDTILFVFLGTIQLAMGVWGGWVAVKSLPAGDRKPIHWWLFPILAALGLVSTVWTGRSNYNSQAEAKAYQAEILQTQKRASEDLAKERTNLEAARLDLKFMSGQLSGLQIMVAAFGKTDQGRSDQTLRALAMAIQTVANHRELANATATPSNKELLDRAILTANKMRALAHELDTEQSKASDSHMRSV
jgi:hypothetical protein